MLIPLDTVPFDNCDILTPSCNSVQFNLIAKDNATCLALFLSSAQTVLNSTVLGTPALDET